MLRYLLYMLRIRRVEFRIAEIPILAIPVLLLINDTAPLKTYAFWEGVLIFFLLFAFGDMINCLADRDLDAVYKPHLSEAVYGLGVRFVTFQVAATAALALALAAHLSWRTNRWPLFALVAIGLTLGAAYSVKPVQLKGRGLAQLVCLWLIIFVGPMIFVGLLVSTTPSLAVLIFSAAYGTLQMGIILINTAEDYPEDLEAGIRTTIVALGLERGVALALWLTLSGAAGVLITLGVLFYQQRRGLPSIMALLLVAAACLYVARDVWKLKRSIAGPSLAHNIQTVKRTAKRVPFWVTVVAWSSLCAALALFYLKSLP
ncbi:MAG TPA: UbiA family prenyltransferase [Pyrinomonadaceae bacterium]